MYTWLPESLNAFFEIGCHMKAVLTPDRAACRVAFAPGTSHIT